MELVLNIARLGVFSAQKFPARRQIVEQRADLDLRAGRFAALAHTFDPSAADYDFAAGDCLVLARRQSKTRDAGDARKSFAAKSKCRDRSEIVGCADLARGMTLEREQRIVTIHPAAVIDYANERYAAATDDRLDPFRARVDAVLDEFFDDRRWALDHLARCHLAGDDFG